MRKLHSHYSTKFEKNFSRPSFKRHKTSQLTPRRQMSWREIPITRIQTPQPHSQRRRAVRL